MQFEKEITSSLPSRSSKLSILPSTMMPLSNSSFVCVPADLICHLAREFFQHIAQMLEVTANKKLRLFRRDVERLIHRIDRVRDFLYLRFEARNGFADRRQQTRAVNLWILERADESVL